MKRAKRAAYRWLMRWASSVLVCLVPLVGMARSSDRAAQIKTSSTSTSVNAGADAMSVLTGNVRILQGTLLATGDRAEIYSGADSQVSRVVLTGSRAHLEQRDDLGHLMEADALRIDYDLTTGQAVLTGQSTARKESMGTAAAPRIIYNVDNGTFSAEGSDADPVKMMLYPRPPRP